MQKLCKCGHMMHACLRTVIYQNKVEIRHVPVLTCECCSRSEVLPGVKPQMTELIGHLGKKPDKKRLSFMEVSELARLMKLAADKDRRSEELGAIVEERINELLDMLLLARSLGDQPWMEDIRARLSQITLYANNAYGIKS